MTRTFEQTGITVADETPDPVELIRIKHPGLGGDQVATTTREAFDKIWAAKGWAIVGDDGQPLPAEAVAPVQPVLTPPSGKQDAGNTPPDTGATK